MGIAPAVLMLLRGVAHLPGLVTEWRLAALAVAWRLAAA
jgi:hypothetical protein